MAYLQAEGSPIEAETLEDLKDKVIGGYTDDAVAVYMKDLDLMLMRRLSITLIRSGFYSEN